MTRVGDNNDTTDFRRATRGVRVLAQDRVTPHSRRPQPVPKQTRRDEQDVVDNLLSAGFEPTDLETGDELLYARGGLQRSVLRKLRRGEYAVTAELDLHGHTVAQARESLVDFLQRSRRARHTCVRIVHGKGRGSPGRKPVLKNKVFHWLCQRDEVLAICPARPFDGGAGAAYVLLKKR